MKTHTCTNIRGTKRRRMKERKNYRFQLFGIKFVFDCSGPTTEPVFSSAMFTKLFVCVLAIFVAVAAQESFVMIQEVLPICSAPPPTNHTTLIRNTRLFYCCWEKFPRSSPIPRNIVVFWTFFCRKAKEKDCTKEEKFLLYMKQSRREGSFLST